MVVYSVDILVEGDRFHLVTMFHRGAPGKHSIPRHQEVRAIPQGPDTTTHHYMV